MLLLLLMTMIAYATQSLKMLKELPPESTLQKESTSRILKWLEMLAVAEASWRLDASTCTYMTALFPAHDMHQVTSKLGVSM